MTTDYDVLIIGAGPGGSIAASVLHREGFHVLVAEKQQFPRFVIGESLLPRVMNLLRDSDLLQAVEDQNFMKKTNFYLNNPTLEKYLEKIIPRYKAAVYLPTYGKFVKMGLNSYSE